eukprot:3834417-Pyramimonas_sp.AAC.1
MATFGLPAHRAFWGPFSIAARKGLGARVAAAGQLSPPRWDLARAPRRRARDGEHCLPAV